MYNIISILLLNFVDLERTVIVNVIYIYEWKYYILYL